MATSVFLPVEPSMTPGEKPAMSSAAWMATCSWAIGVEPPGAGLIAFGSMSPVESAGCVEAAGITGLPGEGFAGVGFAVAGFVPVLAALVGVRFFGFVVLTAFFDFGFEAADLDVLDAVLDWPQTGATMPATASAIDTLTAAIILDMAISRTKCRRTDRRVRPDAQQSNVR